jgi:hypothetical protein
MNENLNQAESEPLQDIPNRRSIIAILSGLPLMTPGILFAANMINSIFTWIIDQSVSSTVTLLGSIAMAIPVCYLTTYQYCALFCCKPIFARAYHEVYFFISVFCLLGSFFYFLDYPSQKSDTNLLIFNVCLCFVGIICLCVGILNCEITSHRRTIFKFCGIHKNEFETKPFSIREYKIRTILGFAVMLIIIVALAVMMICYDYNIQYHHP